MKEKTKYWPGWVAMLVIALVLLPCAQIVLNPIGCMRFQSEERRLEKAMATLPKEADVKTVNRFIEQEGLLPGVLTTDLSTSPPPPEGAKYQLKSLLPFEYRFALGSERLLVDFWFDGKKRLIKGQTSVEPHSL